LKRKVIRFFIKFYEILCFYQGEENFEKTKEWVAEKASEAAAKASEVAVAAKEAIVTGATVVAEKAKEGVKLASEAASDVKDATVQLAADTQAKVGEVAHAAQGLFIN
jgi:hypothetical protein